MLLLGYYQAQTKEYVVGLLSYRISWYEPRSVFAFKERGPAGKRQTNLRDSSMVWEEITNENRQDILDHFQLLVVYLS